MNNHEAHHDDDVAPDLDLLLREIGPREQPSEELTQAVRTSVHAEWQAIVAERRAVRRRHAGLAIAASLAVVGVAIWLAVNSRSIPNTIVAAVTRLSGEAQVADRAGQRVAGIDTRLHARETLSTSAGSRLALQLAPGLALRLDENTALSFADAGHLQLTRGALLVDADPHSPGRPLVVTTSFGEVSHVGTQYEARIRSDSLRVRVREGQVRLQSTNVTAIARTGEQLLISAQGVGRASIPTSGSEWAWAQQIAAPYEIENRVLEEFLRWAARETGRTLVYSTPQAQQEAKTVILHGSVSGLNPDAALAAVLSTTRLTYNTQAADRIVLTLSP